MTVRSTADEPVYFEHSDPEDLANIPETQRKTTTLLKNEGDDKFFRIVITIDDFVDDPRFTRPSKILCVLYARRRRNMLSAMTVTQTNNAVHHIIRVNATNTYVYRLKTTRK